MSEPDYGYIDINPALTQFLIRRLIFWKNAGNAGKTG